MNVDLKYPEVNTDTLNLIIFLKKDISWPSWAYPKKDLTWKN